MVDNFYVHKTKSIDTAQVKRKQGRPPKSKSENSNSNLCSVTAANTHTAQPCKAIKIPSSDIVSRELVSKINTECKKSDRLTIAKLNTVSKPYIQDYKSKLMIEKYSLLPINPQQLTPARWLFKDCQRNTQILRYKLLTPFDLQIVNIHKNLNHWYQVIPHYQSLENTFLGNQTLIKL